MVQNDDTPVFKSKDWGNSWTALRWP